MPAPESALSSVRERDTTARSSIRQSVSLLAEGRIETGSGAERLAFVLDSRGVCPGERPAGQGNPCRARCARP